MIIHVQRLSGGMFEVRPLNDDGSKIERDGNDVPWRKSTCSHGLVWNAIGRLISMAAHFSGGRESVTVDYNNTIDPLRPLSYAPDFRIDYEVRPKVTRYWRSQDGQTFTDKAGWLQGGALNGAQSVLTVAYFHGPLIEVTNVDLDVHDARGGFGCLTSNAKFPTITDTPGKLHRCVCGRWWELREVAGFVVWQQVAKKGV